MKAKHIFYSTLISAITLFLVNCNSNGFKKTPIENFIGKWKIDGREMFKGIEIEISQDSIGDFYGKIITLNDNKYIKMFSEVDDKWVAGIKRNSNFEFTLTEKKIGSQLFGIYGQKTSKQFKAQFIHKDTVGLDSSKPLESKIRYIRIK